MTEQDLQAQNMYLRDRILKVLGWAAFAFVILFTLSAYFAPKAARGDDGNKPKVPAKQPKKVEAGTGKLEEALRRAVLQGKKHAAANNTKLIRATAFTSESLEDRAYLVVCEFPGMVGVFQGGYEDDVDDNWVVLEADQFSALKDSLSRASAR